MVATISQDGTFYHWDLASGAVVSSYHGPARNATDLAEPGEVPPRPATPPVYRLAYSPDGRRLAVVHGGRSPEIWDVATGRVVLLLDWDGAGADAVAWSPDGHRLAAARGRSVKVWDATPQTREDRQQAAASRALAWHRVQARRGEGQRQWFGAAWNLERLIDAEPAVAEHHERGGYAHARLGAWDRARVEFTRAVELDERRWRGWYGQTTLALQRGDLDAYRRLYARAQECIDSTDLGGANAIAWMGALTPHAGADLDRCLLLAQQAVARAASTNDYLNTLGFVLYRLGRYPEAHLLVDRSMRATSTREGVPHDWYLRALVYAQFGDRARARTWLDKAVASADPNTPWERSVEGAWLRREVEALLQER
jgi:tetratricopeptide (TPR) repeat protein